MAPLPPKPIRCCLFDMDGLLINTEDLYTICTNSILREYGKPDLPWSVKAQLQGRPGPDANRLFCDWAQLPCSLDEFNAKVKAIQATQFPTCSTLPGVPELLSNLTSPSTSPNLRIALASSSHKQNYLLKTKHLSHIFKHFPEENIVLGDDPRIGQGRGKPAPDIYLLALKTVNDAIRKEGGKEEDLITPEECLVFEDAVPGVEAGRRAGMQVVWCPHSGLLKEFKGREKEVLAGLTGTYKEEKVIKPEPEIDIKTKGQRQLGAPGEIDDGWAVLVESLEGFPYKRFGIHASS